MQMRSIRAAAAAFALVSLAGCKPKAEPSPQAVAVTRPNVLALIPVFRGALVSDTNGTEDAERRSYSVQAPFDSVGAFYRRALPTLGWQVINELGDRTKLDLYSRHDTLALWIHVEPAGDDATVYTLIATRADSAGSGRP